ncbi:hypothetical protein D3C81_1452950 [compost metagenome]
MICEYNHFLCRFSEGAGHGSFTEIEIRETMCQGYSPYGNERLIYTEAAHHPFTKYPRDRALPRTYFPAKHDDLARELFPVQRFK